MRTELFISLRYLLTKRKEKFISLIGIISVLGIAIGVTALIVVIAVMAGFDRDLRDKIVGNYSHITIAGYSGIEAGQYQDLAGKIEAVSHVQSVSPYVQGQVLAKEGQRFFAVALKGIDPVKEAGVTKIAQYLIQGTLRDLGNDSVILGKELAAYLGLGLGDTLSVYGPSGDIYKLKVVGVFNSGMYDYDLNLIFTNLKTAQQVMGLGSKISAIAVKLDNLYLAQKIKEVLIQAIGYEYNYKTWIEANQSFFAALKLEKLAMFIILTLIVLVASFNISSTLIVMVVEKTKDIGILKSLGMSARSIRDIFTLEGILIGTVGTALGAAAGGMLCWLLKKYQFIKLPQDIYYIDRFPVSIVFWPDMVLIIIASLAISLASTIYPAVKAAGLKPVEALRYE